MVWLFLILLERGKSLLEGSTDRGCLVRRALLPATTTLPPSRAAHRYLLLLQPAWRGTAELVRTDRGRALELDLARDGTRARANGRALLHARAGFVLDGWRL